MARKDSLRPRMVRVDDATWAAFQRIAEQEGTTASEKLRRYMRRTVASAKRAERKEGTQE